ncbi:MAG: hypothetical protein QM760_05525 [Nibricoccus sp.]
MMKLQLIIDAEDHHQQRDQRDGRDLRDGAEGGPDPAFSGG